VAFQIVARPVGRAVRKVLTAGVGVAKEFLFAVIPAQLNSRECQIRAKGEPNRPQLCIGGARGPVAADICSQRVGGIEISEYIKSSLSWVERLNCGILQTGRGGETRDGKPTGSLVKSNGLTFTVQDIWPTA
jgi:hypothetical protein